MKQKIFIVSELFYPDQTSTAYIMTQIALWLDHKAEVEVICGPSTYDGSNVEGNYFSRESIKLHRVSSKNWDKNKPWSRVLRLLILSLKLTLAVYKKTSRGDKILLVTNPAPLLVLISIISTLRNLKLIIIVHDVFPENLNAAGILKNYPSIIKALKSIFDRAYSKAKHLLVLGRDMKDIMSKKVVRFNNKSLQVSVVPNWADVENIYPVEIYPESENEPIKFQFAGNLGRVQGLLPLIQCIKDANNPYIAVEFIGDGALREDLKLFSSEFSCNTVSILPPFKRSEQQRVLNSCDIGIVSLAKGMKGLGVPSKTYNILAAGKPILYIGDRESEIFQLIEDENIGWCFEGANSDLISFLKSIDPSKKLDIKNKGIRARTLALEKYSKEYILNKYRDIILSV